MDKRNWRILDLSNFLELREKYKSFIYKDFSIQKKDNSYYISYFYSIPDLCDFESSWEFPVMSEVDEVIFRKLVFSLGMAETISYWKCVCPQTLIVKCGEMTKEQISWWKKLFYNGLGEFLYRNNINISQEELVQIESKGTGQLPLNDKKTYSGCLIPIGGGKDSVVSMELLKEQKITTYSINGNETIKNIISLCDYKHDDYAARRILDPKIIELNKLGFLNGHIPFSAVVAFSSVIAAYLSGNKYVVLSNETSANEATVKNSFVNHQYSKSFEFEKDFTWYIQSIINTDICYFSLLRPLTEIQIAWLFAKCKKYHNVFRSCNVGSKTGIWCCNCPKCLFVYIILSPFLSQSKLTDIFGDNLLNKESLELYFRELTGIEENKPFECVGTRKEVLIALKAFIQKGEKSLLPEKYRDIIVNEPGEIQDVLTEWVSDNNVPEFFKDILERCIKQ